MRAMSGILEEAACTDTAVVHGAAEAEVLAETTHLNFRGGQVVGPTTLNAISVDCRQ